MTKPNQTKIIVVNDLKTIIRYAKRCNTEKLESCPILHRLEALQEGLQILIKKEKEDDKNNI